MLPQRILVSLVLVPAIIGLLVLDARTGVGAFWLFGLCLVLAVRSAWEMADLLRIRSMQPHFLVCAALSATLIVAGWLAHQPGMAARLGGGAAAIGTGFIGAVLILLLVAAAQFEEPGKTVENLGAHLLIVAYAGMLLAATMQLRWTGPAGAYGYLALGGMILATKAGDIGAYTCGRLWGRRKMAPRLSPGKTWMGAVGAVVFASAGSVAWYQWATRSLAGAAAPSLLIPLIHGAIFGVSGLIGDLCESLLKRDVGRKDAAALFPGFGGLLDLLDSILFSGPIAWLLWQVLPPL